MGKKWHPQILGGGLDPPAGHRDAPVAYEGVICAPREVIGGEPA